MVVARLVKEASWLGRIENAGIANDTRAFLAFIQRHHGAAFRRVVLSGHLYFIFLSENWKNVEGFVCQVFQSQFLWRLTGCRRGDAGPWTDWSLLILEPMLILNDLHKYSKMVMVEIRKNDQDDLFFFFRRAQRTQSNSRESPSTFFSMEVANHLLIIFSLCTNPLR